VNARLVALLSALVLSACFGNPQGLPVSLSICNAVAKPGGFNLTTLVQNKGDKPISSLALSLSFYRDFRYTSYTAATRLAKELDPGEKRDVTFDVSTPNQQSGQAMRCIVTHIGYLDGTSVDLPPAQ
jgi:hypothetical protein